MDGLGRVGDQSKGGGRGGDLGRIIESQTAAAVIGRLVTGQGLLEEAVEPGRGKTPVILTVDPADLGKHPSDAITGLGRDPENRSKGNEAGGQLHFPEQPLLTFAVALEQIPLVEQQDQGLALLLGVPR